MIKEREPALEKLSVILQVFLTLICFYSALWVSGYFAEFPMSESREYLVISFLIIPIWFFILDFFEMGAMARIQRYRHIIKNYMKVVVSSMVLLFIAIEIFDFHSISVSFLIGFALLDFFAMTTLKLTGRMILKHFRRKGYNTRMILIVADDSSMPFITQLVETNDWGYRIGGIITNSETVIEEFQEKFKIYNNLNELENIIDKTIIDEVFFCKRNFNLIEINHLIEVCREVGVSFHIHNKVLAFSGLNPRLSFFNHQFFLSFRNTPGNYIALKIKGFIDYFLTVIILIFISPIMLVIAILIKLEDGGPVFFKQVRVGKHGRLFKCLKFRTMVVNAEELQGKYMDLNEQEGPVFKIKNDPRITKIGKFLRKSSLDELPQFLNVLYGDMSIVGPRPPVPSEVQQYRRCLHRRLSINPGITCIWQVSGRNNIPFEKWMEMDMEYIDNWSLMLDFIIILKTFKVLFSGNGQ